MPKSRAPPLAEGAQAASSQLINHGLGHDGAARIAGTDDQDGFTIRLKIHTYPSLTGAVGAAAKRPLNATLQI